MGLDMYLYKKTYVKNWKHDENRKHEVSVKLNGKPHPGVDPSKVTYIQEEVGYWRKANHIHMWFVNNCQNGVDECQETYLDLEKLKELLEICKTVRDSSKVENEVMTNSKVAEELLPTGSGFFFGGTEYDKWYMRDINDTIEILKTELDKYNELEKLDNPMSLPEYYYHSSW